ncbi:MAG: ABC transporter ATP-binding protein [candidate division Zixibacteria bacterium]|nr:ABC transporter ATP-binding protein [Candidatus Tariuqbacter arcticus]
MPSPAIEIKNLRKTYGEHLAVKDLSLTINRGEMFCFVGPDGAGKTTLMRILCGIIPRTSGEIRILGYDFDRKLAEIKSKIGYLSQRFSLYGDLTVDENIEFFAEIHNVKNYQERRDELLEFTRFKPFRRRFAERLSGGMKQKLALACTLIHTPQLLILDEPTTGVDPVSRRDFWKILSTLLKSEITIVLSTPYLDEAERCTRVAMMNEGEIIALDTPHNIKSSFQGKVIEIVPSHIRRAFKVIKSIPKIHQVQAFGDRLNIIVDNMSEDYPLVQAELARAGIEINRLRKIPASLENIFISLVNSN